jgi:hypothetical protein
MGQYIQFDVYNDLQDRMVDKKHDDLITYRKHWIKFTSHDYKTLNKLGTERIYINIEIDFI